MEEGVEDPAEARIEHKGEKFIGKVGIGHNKELVIFQGGDHGHPGEITHTGEITSLAQKIKGDETHIIVRCKPVVQKTSGKTDKYTLIFPRSNTVEWNKFMHAYSVRTTSSAMTITDSDAVKQEIKLWVTTWNMANNKTTVRAYYDWVKVCVGRIKPDLILFGVQESEDPNMCSFLEAELPNYQVIYQRWNSSTDQWGWVKMAVFAEKSLKPHISNICQSEKSTGLLGGLVKNKGAIAVSMKVYASPICFIVSHLAAHQERVDLRNKNFADIVEQTSFKGFDGEDSILTSHHHVVWTGDLNYRIALSRDEVCKQIEERNYDYLFRYDQLHMCMQNNTTFNGFTEGKRPAFDPTYRYYRKEGTPLGEYNPEKERIPAWCDRVLVRSFPTLKATCDEYNRCYELLPSDHRPVYATWRLEVTIPPAQPPLFASVIGVRPRVQFSRISVLGAKKPRVKLTLHADFLEKSVSTRALSQGRRRAKFLAADIPELTPKTWTTVEHLKTQFIRVFVYTGHREVEELIGVAIIPLEYAPVDSVRKETAEILHHYKVVGQLSYQCVITLVSEMRITGRFNMSSFVRFGTKPVAQAFL